MSLFQFPRDDVITSYSVEEPGAVHKVGRRQARLSLTRDTAQPIERSDQFIVFQLNNEMEGPSIPESSRVELTIEGSSEQADVLISLQMLSFNVGASENIERDTRATMRINFGKDDSSTDKPFDTVFWSIAAGLDLFNDCKTQKAESGEFRTDSHKAFATRPSEIPGGLSRLSFEVVKHKPPPGGDKSSRSCRETQEAA